MGANIMSKDLYEVYMCKFQDDVLYIGSGKIGRHKHCDSGTSNIYGLNRLHFGDVELGVSVVGTFKSQQESLEEEKRLIKLHKPKFNKIHNTSLDSSKFYNKHYLTEECNKSKRQWEDDMDLDDIEVWSFENLDYFDMATRLYFKCVDGGYSLDVDKTKRDINSEKLFLHRDVVFNSKLLVEKFCTHLFVNGHYELKAGWDNCKPDLEELLYSLGYLIDYT